MKFGDVINFVETENQVEAFEDAKVKRIKDRISLLEEALKYTKKTVLIKNHKKELVLLKVDLHYTDFVNKMTDYLSKASLFARQ